jgi:DNA-binding response OmpR family regulator
MRDVGALGRVMLTDDEQRILSFVRRGLRAEGLHVDEARSGEQGLGTG